MTGRKQLLPRTAIPADRVDRVQDSPRQLGKRLAFPRAGPVEIDRHRIVEQGRESPPDHRPHQQHLLPVALRVDPTHPVGGRHAIDFAGCPRLAHIRAALQQIDIADAPLRTRLEPVRQDHFGNPVAVDIPTIGVQLPRHIHRQHVPVPGGMLLHVAGPWPMLQCAECPWLRTPVGPHGWQSQSTDTRVGL